MYFSKSTKGKRALIGTLHYSRPLSRGSKSRSLRENEPKEGRYPQAPFKGRCKLRFAETDKPSRVLVKRDYALSFFMAAPGKFLTTDWADCTDFNSEKNGKDEIDGNLIRTRITRIKRIIALRLELKKEVIFEG